MMEPMKHLKALRGTLVEVKKKIKITREEFERNPKQRYDWVDAMRSFLSQKEEVLPAEMLNFFFTFRGSGNFGELGRFRERLLFL